MPGGDDNVNVKQDESTSFPVKIQGAGVEPFELQVQNRTAAKGPFLPPSADISVFFQHESNPCCEFYRLMVFGMFKML